MLKILLRYQKKLFILFFRFINILFFNKTTLTLYLFFLCFLFKNEYLNLIKKFYDKAEGFFLTSELIIDKNS